MSKVTSSLLKQVISEQRGFFLNVKNSIEREILHHQDFLRWCQLREIVVITGVRRCGKSYLMRLIWKQIKERLNASAENFLFVNFEDEKLINFTVKDFDLLLESFYELSAIDRKEKIYLFFDEIQNIKGWEKFLNRLEEGGKFKIFVTGSNATLLSKEISSVLTGRNFPISLYPLSFREFANYKLKEKVGAENFYLAENRAKLKKLFNEYLDNGGFPEVVLNGFRPILQEYLKNIIYRDIVLRRRIKSEANLREIVSFVISNIGVILSLENIAKMTRIKNLTTVKNYFGYLGDSFLFYNLSLHSYSIKKQIYNPDKIFVVDTGIYNEVAITNSQNEGRLLENIVFLQLKRKNKMVFYFKEKNECDFVVQDKNKVTAAIQVTKILGDSNRQRELGGLCEALKKYGLKEGVVLTADESDDLVVDGCKITVVPIWQWCLTYHV